MNLTEIDPGEVSFNPEIVAAAWEAFDDGIPALAAAALANEYRDDVDVTPNEGIESDRDVHFPRVDLLVEEKAMGVCDEPTAKKYAPAYIKLARDDGRVLALNPAQIMPYSLP